MRATLITILASVIATIASGKTAYLIRHGEKPENNKDKNLSPAGYARAECLASKVFAGSSTQFKPPAALMAQRPVKGDMSLRPIETLTPLSKTLGIEIQTPCTFDEHQCAIDYINNQTAYPLVVAWEHKNLAEILTQLTDSADPIKYPGDRFDLVWKYDVKSRTYETFYEDC